MKVFILAVCILGLASRTSATTCSASVNPCQATERVTSTCNTDAGSCECRESNYISIPTGCAPNTPIGTPTIDAGEYSGEVVDGRMLSLSCHPPSDFHASVGTTYEWFTDGTKVDGQTSQTYGHTAVAGTTTGITCKIHYGALESAASNAFQVIGYARGTDSAGYTLTIAATIGGYYTGGVVDDTQVTLTCNHRPLDGDIGYKWTDAADADVGTADTPLMLPAPVAAETYTCELVNTGLGPHVLGTFPEVTTVAAGTALALLGSKTAAITSPAIATTFEQGTNIAPTCALTDVDDIAFDDSDVGYKWYDGDQEIVGQTLSTLDTTSLAIGSHTIKCGITPTGGTEAESSTVAITAVAASSTGVAVDVHPTPILDGNFMMVRCLLFATTQAQFDEMTYSWAYDGMTIFGQTDHSLQVYGATDAANGNSKPYTCTATRGTSATAFASSSPVNVVTVASTRPTVTSNKMTTNYGTNEGYVLTCHVTMDPESFDITYEWRDAGVSVPLVTSSSLPMVAVSTAVDYDCKATVGGTDTLRSNTYTVQGKAIKHVTFTGVSAPVEGTSPVYTCTAMLAGGSASYSILAGSDEVGTESTYTISNIAAGVSTSYSCVVTVDGESVTSTAIAVVSTPRPAAPQVHIPSPLNTGGSYTLTCTSSSVGSDTSAEYSWTFTPTSGTAQTYTDPTIEISSASSANQGTYTCSVTVNGQTSDPSIVENLSVGATSGMPCTVNNFHTECTTDYSRYTGNCIASRCECASGVTLYQDACGEPVDGDGAGAVGVSLLTLTLTLMAYFFV